MFDLNAIPPFASPARRRLAGGLVLALLGGCTTGSSASFSQAPIFFAESVDETGEFTSVAADEQGDRGKDQASGVAFDAPVYAAIAGNALLPVRAPAHLVQAAASPADLASASIAAQQPTATIVVDRGAVAIATPIASLAVNVPAPGRGPAPLGSAASGVSAVASGAVAAVSALPVVSAAVPTPGGVTAAASPVAVAATGSVGIASVVPAALPAVAIAAAPAPVGVQPGVTAAVPTIVPAAVSVATPVTAVPVSGAVEMASNVLPGVTVNAPGMAPVGGLAASAAELVRMCLGRRCR